MPEARQAEGQRCGGEMPRADRGGTPPGASVRKPPLTILIWLAVAFACAGLIGSAGFASWNARERAIERATVTSQNLTRVLSQHTERMVDSVDMLLKMVARELGPDTANMAQRSATTASLAYLTQDLPHVLALRVLDGSTGETLFDFVRGREIETAADLASVEAHRAGPQVAMAVGFPVKDAAKGAWMLPVSRRIGGREGIPGNVVVAYLSLDYLQRFLAQLEMGRDGSVTLVRTDGIVAARRPYREVYIGGDITASPLFSAGLFKSGGGVYETVSVADGIARIFAFRRVGTLPLIITVGVSRQEVTAAWMNQAARDVGLAIGAVVLLLIAGAFLSMEVRRRDSAETALSASEERLRLALRARRMVAWPPKCWPWGRAISPSFSTGSIRGTGKRSGLPRPRARKGPSTASIATTGRSCGSPSAAPAGRTPASGSSASLSTSPTASSRRSRPGAPPTPTR
jgi:hypothetical protein